MVHTRHSLEKLSRTDLQKLCKGYGVKANLKSDAIIDLILDANTPHPPAARKRSVSSRLPTTKLRHSSMVVHEPTTERAPAASQLADNSSEPTQPSQEDSLPPAARTRKAKDTQSRLGVGRPRLAGGDGPRTATKFASLTRGKRSKSGKNTKKVVEEVIAEEPGPEPDEGNNTQPEPEPAAIAVEPTFDQVEPSSPQGTQAESGPNSQALSALADIDKYVANAIRPLYEQLQSFKHQVEHMNTLKSEVDRLQSQVARVDALEEQVASLSLQVEELRGQSSTSGKLEDEVARLKEAVTSQILRLDEAAAQASRPALRGLDMDPLQPSLIASLSPSTPHFTSTPRVRSTSESTPVNREAGPSTQHGHPGFAPSMLGKRFRSPEDSDITGILQQIREDDAETEESADRPARSPKKRARISSEEPSEGTMAPPATTRIPEDQTAPPRSTFSIFTGCEPNDMDDSPPTSHLPNFYGPPSPSEARTSRAAGSSSHQATENGPTPPFSLTYMVPPTPGSSLFSSAFPLLETPTSPSPNHNSQPIPAIYRARNDMFHALGLPNPGRPKSATQPQCVDPAALTQSQAAPGQETIILPSKRTMFGTELEDDTRFGEFGTEGVGAPFWARM